MFIREKYRPDIDRDSACGYDERDKFKDKGAIHFGEKVIFPV